MKATTSHHVSRRRIIFIVGVVMPLSGCVTVEDTIYLHGLETESGLNTPAVFLADSLPRHPVQVSFRVGYATQQMITGRIPVRGPLPPDTLFTIDPTHNLVWSYPASTVGLDLGIAVTSVFGMEGGIQLSPGHEKTFFSGYAGLALSGGGPDVFLRLSGGIRWSNLDVVVPSTVVTRTQTIFSSPVESVYFFRDSLSMTPIDWYLTLSLNTVRSDLPVNFFVQGAMLRQSLARFTPHYQIFPLVVVNYSVTDMRLDYTATLWTVTPGITVDLGPSARALAGARWVMHDIEGGNPESFWMPFLQVDLLLGW